MASLLVKKGLARLASSGAMAAFLLACFVTLGIIYAFQNPLFSKPDETNHLAYVKYLKTNLSLPGVNPALVQRAADRAVYPEAHQPPLYYLVVAVATIPLSASNDVASFDSNPHFLSTEIGNKTGLVPIYPRAPLSADALTIYVGRLVSLAFGVLAGFYAYLAAKELLPEPAALLALAIFCFNPQYLFTSTAFGNDSAVAAFSALVLFLALRAARRGFTAQRGALLGTALGLATLSKLSGLALSVAVPAALAYDLRQHRQPKRSIAGAGAFGLLLVLLTGWWFLRNYFIYGDAFAAGNILSYVGPRSTPFSLGDLEQILVYAWKSYWLDFSAGGLAFADSGIYLGFSMVVLCGLAGTVLAYKNQPQIRPFLLLLVLPIAAVLVSYLALTAQTRLILGGGRLLFPAASGIAVLLALGLASIVPTAKAQAWLTAGLTLALMAFAFFSPLYYIPQAYPKATILAKLDEGHPRHRTTAHFGDKIQLIGYNVNPERRIITGESLKVALYWQALGMPERNYSVFLQLLGKDCDPNDVLVSEDTFPAYGSFPTSQWRAGELVADQYALKVPPGIKSLQQARLVLGMYDFGTKSRLPISMAQPGQVSDFMTIGRFGLAPRTSAKVPEEHRLAEEMRVGDLATLVGRKVEVAPLAGSYRLSVRLYWQARARTQEDYAIFVHVNDSLGHLVAQHDGDPRGGCFPTSLWEPGDMIVDDHQVDLSVDRPAPELQIMVGLYDRNTLSRLPAFDGRGRRYANDALPIDVVMIKRNELER